MISEYSVAGMSCDHCVGRVTEEVSRLDGVTGVSVDLPTGLVSVSSQSVLARETVANAIDEAGYQLVSA